MNDMKTWGHRHVGSLSFRFESDSKKGKDVLLIYDGMACPLRQMHTRRNLKAKTTTGTSNIAPNRRSAVRFPNPFDLARVGLVSAGKTVEQVEIVTARAFRYRDV